MYLKKLNISGFKSFAKNTTLEFTQGITAIVGPNGSGKSNIADSIRWVMGEQSIKTLRGKKSEDVIFSGSDKKARLGLAEVSLELDNTDKKVPIEFPELLITRRIYRSGQSDYLINNAKTTLNEVNLLLTKSNFGHRTYSVIGQGMIDNFLIASPTERKEFFEEATGVKQYQIKKQQSINKLEHVWQNLNTLKIKISEMEPQLKLLTRQVKKLNKRKEIETELKKIKLNYYSAYWQDINQKYLQQKEIINKLNNLKNKQQVEWQNLSNNLTNITKDNKTNKEIEQLRLKEEKLINDRISLKERFLKLKLSTNNLQQIASSIKNISYDNLNFINLNLNKINNLHEKLIKSIDKNTNNLSIKQQLLNINKKIISLTNYIQPYIKKSTYKQEKTPKNILKEKELNTLEIETKSLNAKLLNIQNKIKESTQKDSLNRSSLWEIQEKYQKAQQKLNQTNNQINEARIVLARIETKRFDLKQEIQIELNGLDNLSQSQIKPLSDNEKIFIQQEINKLKNQLEIIGGFDPQIEEEYKTTNQRFKFLNSQAEDLTNTSESLKKLINELNSIIKNQINKSFQEINKYFKTYFKLLFEGGYAELILVKEKETHKKELIRQENLDKEESFINFFQKKDSSIGFAGIDVQATPPGKKLKSINALSGGERALTSIALICAIISTNPSPFVVLDEVDAALDESNSIRFASILSNLSHKTQFIVITHNRTTMEKANLLYGITMDDNGISKLISIKLEETEKYSN